MSEGDESRLDEVLRQLEDDAEGVSKAFGKAPPTSGFTPVNPTPTRRSQRPARTARGSGGPYPVKADFRIAPYPNVYLAREGEPVEWVGFFHNEEAANEWIKNRPEEFVVEFAPRRDLPLWGAEERKRKNGPNKQKKQALMDTLDFG